MDEQSIALEAIRKKLVGKTLNYKEIFAIMDEISHDRLGDVLTTYFVASGYSKGFSNEEIYFLTKAMVDTGEHLKFTGIVADKHSIGGIPGGRITMIVVPIIAAAGFRIPKSSSRAITTPAGTADAMEVLAKVTFTENEIYEIIEKTNACMVWGGAFKIAPADDEIIKIEAPLLFESFDKILVSVMAKKIAFGSNHIVIDIPYGATVKVHSLEDAKVLGNKFKLLAHKFDRKLEPIVHKVDGPAGNGIGPLLEAKDALQVLEQKKDRPIFLEELAIIDASILLKLCLQDMPRAKKKEVEDAFENTETWARHLLSSGAAFSKMREIIHAQKGHYHICSEDLLPAHHRKIIFAPTRGKIKSINNKNITIISRILGAPYIKDAGMVLNKKIKDTVDKGEDLVTFYSESTYKLEEAVDTLENFPIYEIER